MERSVRLQAKYYDAKHRDVEYKVGYLVLVSTRNLKIKGVPSKLQKRFVGPFRVLETIREQAYRLALPDEWKIHPVFHVSLLRDWKAAGVQEDRPVDQNDVPEVEEPFWEIEKLLRWRKVKRNKKILKEYLVLWRGFSISEASWITQDQLINPRLLQQFIDEDQPEEERV